MQVENGSLEMADVNLQIDIDTLVWKYKFKP